MNKTNEHDEEIVFEEEEMELEDKCAECKMGR